jgi:CRISPR-associated protein Cas1
MSWRIIYITDAQKISLNINHVQVIHQEQKYHISLEEIGIIVIEDMFCNITCRLLSELAKSGICVIVMGDNHLPVGEMQPLQNNVRSSKRLLNQINWDDKIKEEVWTKIISYKILNQINTLSKLKKINKLDIIINLFSTITLGDKTNREGTIARIYFKEMFGESFVRFEEDIINACLNFSYHLVRTLITKEIIGRGYNTQLGLNHKSEYNYFNLSDDLIEIYRPIVDYFVYNILLTKKDRKNYRIDKELKKELIDILNNKISICGKQFSILNSVAVYVNDVLSCIESGKLRNFYYPVLEKY